MRLFYLQVAVVVQKNYSDIISDAGFNESEPTSEQTTANLSHTEQFSFYSVRDRDSRFLVEFNYWIQAFLFKLIPCVLLTALTVMLIVVMHQANVRRMKLKSQVKATVVYALVNPLWAHENRRATDHYTAMVHWPLMGELLHLVQCKRAWAICSPVQSPPRCTKCNSPPVDGQCINFISLDVAL